MIGVGWGEDLASFGIALLELLPETAVASLGAGRSGSEVLYGLNVRRLKQAIAFEGIIGAWGVGR